MPTIVVQPSGVTLSARPGETVLDAVLRSGFHCRFGCRRGGCGTCKVHLIAGEVRYAKRVAAPVLSDDERGRGGCVSCRAVPISDLVIRLQEDDQLRRVIPAAFAPTTGDHAGG